MMTSRRGEAGREKVGGGYSSTTGEKEKPYHVLGRAKSYEQASQSPSGRSQCRGKEPQDRGKRRPSARSLWGKDSFQSTVKKEKRRGPYQKKKKRGKEESICDQTREGGEQLKKGKKGGNPGWDEDGEH